MISENDFINIYVPKIPRPEQPVMAPKINHTYNYFYMKDLVTIFYKLIVENEGNSYFAIHEDQINKIRLLLSNLMVKSLTTLMTKDPIVNLFRKDIYRERIAKSLKLLNDKYKIIELVDKML